MDPQRASLAAWLRAAARLALRGHGGAEPNPCVGAVIVDGAGRLLGSGFHRRCGEAHAEVAALADARRRGHDVRGATMLVTLEPCNSQGRTGPCSEAIVAAGIRTVVVARRDPHPKGQGGLERLRAAGVAVHVEPEPLAMRVGEPFVHRVTRGLPWVVAKWAQTIDGRIATRSGDSRWISSVRSRAMVHRERGRVDAMLTGIGTVLADDPLLTARGVRVRRVARRVVVDPGLRIPSGCRLLSSLEAASVTIACREELLGSQTAEALRGRGVEIVGLPRLGGTGVGSPGGFAGRGAIEAAPSPARQALDLGPLLAHLAREHTVATVLVEAGPGLLGALLSQDLVNLAWVFVAPSLLGDAMAPGPVAGESPLRIAEARGFELLDARRRGSDLSLVYAPRRRTEADSMGNPSSPQACDSAVGPMANASTPVQSVRPR